MNLVVWFADVGKDDVVLTGGKGANLGELTLAGLPVPPASSSPLPLTFTSWTGQTFALKSPVTSRTWTPRTPSS